MITQTILPISSKDKPAKHRDSTENHWQTERRKIPPLLIFVANFEFSTSYIELRTASVMTKD